MFDEILDLCKKYSNDSSYVYKISSNLSGQLDEHEDTEWLIVLQKLDDTLTNEEREGITNRDYAKFRADKLKVIDIINIIDVKKKSKCVINAYLGDTKIKTLFYEVNKIVMADSFDPDLNAICSNGIHYFKTPLPALYYAKVHKKYNGKRYFYSPSGELCMIGNYLNGKKNGKWYEYINDGKTMIVDAIFENDLKNGKFIEYYKSGGVMTEGEFIDDEKEGVWIEYHKNGNKRVVVRYLKGLKNGNCSEYYSNKLFTLPETKQSWPKNDQSDCKLSDNVKSEGIYVDDEKDGMWFEYLPNGELIAIEHYFNGALIKVYLYNRHYPISEPIKVEY